MRIIRPYGHTNIKKEARYLQPKRTLNQREEPEAITAEAHFQENEKFHKSLYTSIVDQWIAKPNKTKIIKIKGKRETEKIETEKIEDKPLNHNIMVLRLYFYFHPQSPYHGTNDFKEIKDFLGVPKISDKWIKFYTSLEACVNYFGERRKYFKNNQNKIAVKNAYYGEDSPQYMDFSKPQFWQDMAGQIGYLYNKKKTGLSTSVINNDNLFKPNFNQQMRLYFFEQYLKDGHWQSLDEYAQPQYYNLNKLLTDINKLMDGLKQKEKAKKQQNQKPERLHYKKIAPLMNAHHKSLNDKRIQNNNGEYDASQPANQLYFYKMMVKEVLQSYFPKGAQSKQLVQCYRPLSEGEIQAKIAYKIRNKIISHFIRLGKFIFYTTDAQEELMSEKAKQAYENNFLDSHLQLTIKQAEGFARQNLSAVSFAAMSLKNIVDNKGKIDDDLLGEAWGKRENEREFCYNKFKLYYGLGFGEDEGENIIHKIRNYMHDLRNNLFHFKGYNKDEILGKLYEYKPQDHAPLIKDYIKKDEQYYQELIASELFALQLHHTNFPQEDYGKIVTEYAAQPSAEITLPGFQKLLKRAENIGQKAFLPRPKDVTTEKDDKENLIHALFKNIYNHGFSAWMEEQGGCYSGWVNAAIERTENAKSNKVAKEDRKITQIPPYAHKSLKDYFAELSAQTALENSTQSHKNRYIADKKAAKANANYVHNFITDFFIFAFQDYLKDKGFDKLCRIQMEEQTQTENPFTDFACKLSAIEIDEKYHIFYLYLHLLNGDHLNHLQMQLIKLQAAQKGNEAAKTLTRIIAFYLKIKDYKLMNIAQKGDGWKDFYEAGIRFADDSFCQQAGFIELSRFIGIEKLKRLFEGSPLKATQDDIKQLAQWEDKKQTENIAHWHKKAAEIHEKLAKKKWESRKKEEWEWKLNKKEKEQYREYGRLIQKIEQYKHLHKKVTCQYAMKYHQLMLAIAGRLVGYSQLLERDLYFYLIAMNAHMGGVIEIDEEKTNASNNPKKLFIKVNGKKANCFYGQNANLWSRVKEKTEDNDAFAKSLCFFEKSWAKGFKDTKNIRNDIAHFNYFIKGDTSLNFTRLMNETRQLMAYDRKLKNAVSKSLIDLCLERGFALKFKVNNNHELEKNFMHPQKIIHLKNINIKKNKLDAIKIDSEAEDYIQLIEKIF